MTNRTKGRPFLELFALSLQEDYRFPLLEFFAFSFALSTFILAIGNLGNQGISQEQTAFYLLDSVMEFPLFIFMALILKNIAFGLGNDLEKGTIQTILSYPLKRKEILIAKLLSAILIPILMLVGIQMFTLTILAPATIISNIESLTIIYLASLSFPLLMASIILLLTLLTRKGGVATIVGIIVFFATMTFQNMFTYLAVVSRSKLLLQVISVFNPRICMQLYYHQITLPHESYLWLPTFPETLFYVATGYFLILMTILICFYLFCRRLNV